MLLNILIVFFIGLLGYQLFVTLFSNKLVEGLDNITTTGTTTNDYKPYNTNDPNNPNSALILSQQNAGNIEVLKGRIDGLDGVKTRVDTMQQDINSMQIKINDFVQQQADYASDLVGTEPIDASDEVDTDENDN